MVLLDEKTIMIDQAVSCWMRKNIRVSSFRWLALVRSAKSGLLLFQNFCFQPHCKENLKKNPQILKFSKTPEITSSNTVLDSSRK
jgi:hypothetical protein